MDDQERVRIESLLSGNQELDQLWRQHLDYERQLSDIDSRAYLSSDERLERKQIQKRKLAGKDRISQIVASHSAA